jgi:hypothetical protein
MSDTPLTDKEAVGAIGFYSCATVPADLARRLERSLNDATKALKAIAGMDTSQDASPGQCAAVLLAMFALDKIKDANP